MYDHQICRRVSKCDQPLYKLCEKSGKFAAFTGTAQWMVMLPAMLSAISVHAIKAELLDSRMTTDA